jgi:hypothetical protein
MALDYTGEVQFQDMGFIAGLLVPAGVCCDTSGVNTRRAWENPVLEEFDVRCNCIECVSRPARIQKGLDVSGGGGAALRLRPL